MLTRSFLLLPIASLILACAGCDGGRVSFSYYDRRPARIAHVYAHPKHVCTHECHEHYWDGARVIVLSGHRHHPGCGHVWDGKHWVVVKKARSKEVHRHPPKVAKVKHVHNARCGCAYDRRAGKWIKVKRGHVHGPGCGHVLIEGRWCLRN